MRLPCSSSFSDRKLVNLIKSYKKAADAVEMVTDGLSIEQVVAQIVELYRAKSN